MNYSRLGRSFYKKLIGRGSASHPNPSPGLPFVKSVERWFKKARIKIPIVKWIFIPVHVPGHWQLVVCNVCRERFEFYCSLHGQAGMLMSNLAAWLDAEVVAGNLKQVSEPSTWTRHNLSREAPHQGICCHWQAAARALSHMPTTSRPPHMYPHCVRPCVCAPRSDCQLWTTFDLRCYSYCVWYETQLSTSGYDLLATSHNR